MQVELHRKVELEHIRVFTEGRSYLNKDEYDAIVTVHHLGDDEVWLSGLKGTFSRSVHKAISKTLKDEGIKVIRYEKAKPKGLVSRVFNTLSDRHS